MLGVLLLSSALWAAECSDLFFVRDYSTIQENEEAVLESGLRLIYGLAKELEIKHFRGKSFMQFQMDLYMDPTYNLVPIVVSFETNRDKIAAISVREGLDIQKYVLSTIRLLATKTGPVGTVVEKLSDGTILTKYGSSFYTMSFKRFDFDVFLFGERVTVSQYVFAGVRK